MPLFKIGESAKPAKTTDQPRTSDMSIKIDPPGSIALIITRPDVKSPWGLKLEGTHTRGQPIVVAVVLTGSNADKGGIKVGDHIETIGEQRALKMTLSEVQDAIKKADTALSITVKRMLPSASPSRTSSIALGVNSRTTVNIGDPLSSRVSSIFNNLNAPTPSMIIPVRDMIVVNRPTPTSHWGIEINYGEGLQRVLKITKLSQNGCGEKSGLKVDDRIISLNGADAKDMTVDDAYKILNKTGVEFKIVYERINKNDLLEVTLEKKRASIIKLYKEIASESKDNMFTDKKAEAINPYNKEFGATMTIILKRSSIKLSWGLKIQGGLDTDAPLIISRISEGGVAEKNGLKINDLIIEINGTSFKELSLVNAQEIFKCDNAKIELTILRVVDRDGNNSEINDSLSRSETDSEVRT